MDTYYSPLFLFEKYKDKIIYLLIEYQVKDSYPIHNSDSPDEINGKKIMNALKRENFQRNYCYQKIKDFSQDDLIIVNDLDEIPNLEVNNLKDSKNKFVFFNQLMIYYKLNLYLQDFPWVGSKACKKKYLKSPQWLRNIKDRIYPWWRLDILFSEKKFSDIKLYQNGGWHFSYIKNPKDIEILSSAPKFQSYLNKPSLDFFNLVEYFITFILIYLNIRTLFHIGNFYTLFPVSVTYS